MILPLLALLGAGFIEVCTGRGPHFDLDMSLLAAFDQPTDMPCNACCFVVVDALVHVMM